MTSNVNSNNSRVRVWDLIPRDEVKFVRRSVLPIEFEIPQGIILHDDEDRSNIEKIIISMLVSGIVFCVLSIATLLILN